MSFSAAVAAEFVKTSFAYIFVLIFSELDVAYQRRNISKIILLKVKW